MTKDESGGAEKLGELFQHVWDRGVRNHFKYSSTAGPVAGNVHDIRFLALALCGEAGELANVIKKQWRGDSKGIGTDAMHELADVLAYTMMLAHQLDMSPSLLLRTVDQKQDAFVAKMQALESNSVLLSDATPKQLRDALSKTMEPSRP